MSKHQCFWLNTQGSLVRIKQSMVNCEMSRTDQVTHDSADQYLGMDAIERVVDQEQARRMVGAHTFAWFVPRKPRVSVRVHDAASGERVIGVRYRVMTRPHMQPVPARRVSFGGSLIIDQSNPQVFD